MANASDDRASLLREIRAHLEWERDAGAVGVPYVERSAAGAGAAKSGATPHNSAARAIATPGPGASRGEERSPLTPETERRPSTHVPAEELRRGPTPDLLHRLSVLENEVRECTRCELAKGRTKSVFARGNPASPLVFVGEGPGQEEDRQGLPFVGAAGQLLDKMISAMGFGRNDVYICNVVKCRPPGNRTPLPVEAQACSSYLNAQLDVVAPRVIVALGRCAAENMGLVPGGGGWRGHWGKFRGVDVMPTYHPAFLLRSPEFKRPVWEDLQKVMARLRATS